MLPQVLAAVRMHMATASQDALLLIAVADGNSSAPQFLIKAVPTCLLLVCGAAAASRTGF